MAETDGVIPTVNGLEEPPPVDEREITAVDFEHTDGRFRINRFEKECQHCGAHVDLRERHTRASIWTGDGVHRTLNKPVYCDKECWLAWLGGEKE